MYEIKPTKRYQKDLKRIQKRGYDLALLSEIIKKLASGKALPLQNKDHSLMKTLKFLKFPTTPSLTRSHKLMIILM